jgi:hypothetical protein
VGKAQKPEVHPKPEVFEPRLLGGKLDLEHAIVVRLPHPTQTEVQQFAHRVAQCHGFEGMALFFPE